MGLIAGAIGCDTYMSKFYILYIISMIAPTSKDRIKEIAAVGEGFLYIVSSLGVKIGRAHV